MQERNKFALPYIPATQEMSGSHLGNATYLDERGIERYAEGPNQHMSVRSEVDWNYGHSS